MTTEIKSSEDFAKRLRYLALNMVNRGKSSHIGAVLSMADLMAVLYHEFLNVSPDNPKMENRDRFILSKGHAGAGVYASLAIKGFFPEKELYKHYQDGSIFSGHVSHKGVPGVEFSTGSLGHGLPVATGMAYAGKLKGDDHKVVCILGDGELDEGSNWESIMFAPHHKLDNLIAIIDYNKLQSLDLVSNTLGLEPLVDKWESFGWHVQKINGHNHEEIKEALGNCKKNDKPHVLIADTVKGKGVSFMENQVLWHYRPPNEEELSKALEELEL